MRAAHLRSLHGDTDGAIEARKLVIRMIHPQEQEARAWAYSQLGTEYFNIGKFDEAEQSFEQALKILPDYHWALAGKGKVLAAKGDLQAAAQIYETLRRIPQADRESFSPIFTRKWGARKKRRKFITPSSSAKNPSKKAICTASRCSGLITTGI